MYALTSACQTFLRFSLRVAPVVCLLLSHRTWPQSSVQEHYAAVVKATHLDAEGKAPFHLRMTAEVYNLTGKDPQSAVVEEWWASPKRWRIEMKGAGVDEVQSSGQQVQPAGFNRARYLLGALLVQVVHPLVMPREQQDLAFKDADRTIAGVKLNCLAVHIQHVGSIDRLPPSYCLGPNQELRLVEEGSEIAVRNRIGKFHNTDVGLEIAIGFNGRKAVDGSVAVLQGFDPAQSRLPEFAGTEAPAVGGQERAAQPPFIMTGLRTGGLLPVYPEEAKHEHLHGAVVLCALITAEGKIDSLDVVATPADVLTRAARDAVKTWTYTPFLTDGEPVQVTTTVTVNFNISF